LTPKKEGNRIPSALKAAQHNANSSFDLEKSMARAKKLAEVEPPPDAKDWEGKPDKAELSSPNPGSGD
jgi:hypothetical protein